VLDNALLQLEESLIWNRWRFINHSKYKGSELFCGKCKKLEASNRHGKAVRALNATEVNLSLEAGGFGREDLLRIGLGRGAEAQLAQGLFLGRDQNRKQ